MTSGTATSTVDTATRDGIFVSYRREDSEGYVQALEPGLLKHFGIERIFIDTHSIDGGQDFGQELQSFISKSAVMLVVIGRGWLNASDSRHQSRRLDDPKDWVRLEVANALQDKRVRVVPVLVGGATMPQAEDLPEDLKPLATRNAVEVQVGRRFERDVDGLIEVIERATKGGHKLRSAQRILSSYRNLAVIAGVLTVLTALGFWAAQRQFRSQAVTPSPPQTNSRSDPQHETPPKQEDPAKPVPTTTPPVVVGGDKNANAVDTTPDVRKPVEPKKPTPRPPVPTARGNSPQNTQNPAAGRTSPAGTASSASTGGITNSGTTATPPPAVDLPRSSPVQQNPPAATVSPQPVPPPEADQRPAIRAVIEKFREAFNARNSAAMREVYPNATANVFGDSKNCVNTVAFTALDIDVISSTVARVKATSVYTCQPDTKQKARPGPPVTDYFDLSRHGSSWSIDLRSAPL